MDSVLVLQSFREHEVTSWIGRCLSSVQAWCRLQGYDYVFAGDDLFDRVPPWYTAKVGQRKPVLADLARLLWIKEVLDAGRADVVAWLDADLYVFAPDHLTVAPQSSCVFGLEHWLQGTNKGGLRVHKNVHNAYCAFRRDCPILPFLIEAVQRMVRRVDAARIAPQFVGPKLLSSLHNIVGFELDASVGALSPLLVDALVSGQTERLARLQLDVPLVAANLCASLHPDDEAQMAQLLDVLNGFKNGLK